MLNQSLTCALVAGFLLLGGCRRQEAAAQRTAPSDLETRTVRVVTATEKDTERILFANGILAARDQAALSVKVAGRLENIPVDVGSVVKLGETVGQIQKR